jgi:sortase A
MAGRRHLHYFLSLVLLAAGASLLTYAGVQWLMPQELPPAAVAGSPRDPALSDLPPALAPAPSSFKQEHHSLSVVPYEIVDAPLLPESPAVDAGETAVPQDAPAAKPAGANAAPQRIIIPALGIDAPVYRARLEDKWDGRRNYQQWSVPNAYAAGWHETSAPLGAIGNTVLNGHNNVHGSIFGDLAQLPVGEQIILAGEQGAHVYRVAHHELLEERGLSLRERMRNARWIAPTQDERLTLVTCWPNTTNSHRLIVVAEPAGLADAGAAVAAKK